jgi:hypothetical protein
MSLLKHAKQYLANQSKYAHLNAFVSRPEPSSLRSRIADNLEHLHDERYDNCILEDPRQLYEPVRCHGCEAAARCGCRRRRKDKHGRVWYGVALYALLCRSREDAEIQGRGGECRR